MEGGGCLRKIVMTFPFLRIVEVFERSLNVSVLSIKFFDMFYIFAFWGSKRRFATHNSIEGIQLFFTGC